jgi:hypothetical protein
MSWICENDRYCHEPTLFATVEDFERMVRSCFSADELEGFQLHVRSGIVVDETGETVLRAVD